jgi:uncharacterized NAD(P)/FAD-binding protein YdhS
MQDSNYDIIVIGGGAQATAFLSSIYHFIMKNNKYINIKIGVIDKKENLGCGNVYNYDYPWILMNTPTSDLSVVKEKPHDFSEWVNYNIDKLSLCDNDSTFVPRSVFGLYLKDKYHFFKLELMHKGIFIEDIDDLSTDILYKNESNNITVSLKSGKILKTNFIVFATGPSTPQDHYNLIESKNYIHNPFPANKNLSHIPNNLDVAIIGSNLTAIDIAITLKHLGHHGKIIMASRNGKLPEVKGKYLKSYPPKKVLYSNFESISKQKGAPLKLLDLVRLIRKELMLHGFYWRDYFFEKKSKPECIDDFKLRVEEARNGPTPFNIILGMIPEIAKTWRLVSNDQLEIFMSKFYRYVHQKHGAIPLVNAEKILSLLQSDQLLLKGYLNNIIYNNHKYTVCFENSENINCNYIINATGPKRIICDKFSKLPYTTPCTNGFIKEISIGGIIIDTATGMILKNDGMFENKFRAIGHNAEGSHPFINNFAWILESGYEVAESLLIEVANGKSY